MSVDYMLFLRGQPDLAALEEEYDLERDGTDYIFAGFRLWIHEYTPTDDDPLADHPWQGEMKWVLAANGRHSDHTYDDFHALMAAVGERYRGGLWCDHGEGEIDWYGWDADDLAKRAKAWTADEITRWFDAAGEAEIAGARAQVAEIVVGRLKEFTMRERQHVLLALWRDRCYSRELADVIGDALLELDPDRVVAAAQRELREERKRRAIATAPLPTTREAVAELFERADHDEVAQGLVRRATVLENSAFVRDAVSELLAERARSGGRRPSWVTISEWIHLYGLPERFEKPQRDGFAARGPFAREIVREWERSDAHEARTAHLIERRRRGGEIYAGIPDDIRAMARTNRQEAIAEYARRYELPLEKAKQVVDANA